MINVAKELKKRGLKSRIVLQIHDELLIETELSEKKEVYEILNECMKNAANLSVPLEVEISEGKSWFQAKQGRTYFGATAYVFIAQNILTMRYGTFLKQNNGCYKGADRKEIYCQEFPENPLKVNFFIL